MPTWYTKSQSDTLLSAKAPTASPTFTGTPAAPTPAAGTNTTQIATTAFVRTALLATQTQQTGTAYTLILADANTVVELNNASTTTVTVPANATAAIPIGSSIILRQMGAGQVTVAAAGGVTLRSRGSALKIAGQYAEVVLSKRATDEWIVSGDLTT